MGVPFGFDPSPELAERFARVAEIDRLRAAFDGERIVATFGAYSLQLTVPGGVLPAAGTTVVAVMPTHRRRGLLRSLMTEHLAEAHDRNEPLAALWASESGIYGRFGYGPASERYVMTLDKAFARLREPVPINDSMQLIDVDRAVEVFPSIYEPVASRRPGMYSRSAHWWRHRVFADPEHFRQGATAHRRVLHTRGGTPAGYVVYRTRTDFAAHTAEVRIIELVGVDAEAEKALWQFVFGIDLVSTIRYWNQPVDDPLRWWLEQPRRMERNLSDALWVRPVDVVAALENRRYACAGSVTLRIDDPLCPWNEGTYRLTAAPDGSATCERASGAADVALTPCALGAIYLGGNWAGELERAAVISGSRQAITQLDAMFRWSPGPWCQEVF
jgi:predicted acetyltransferase